MLVDLQTQPNPCRWVFIRLPLNQFPEALSRSLMQMARELGLQITKPWVLSAQSTYWLSDPPGRCCFKLEASNAERQQLARGWEKGWKEWSKGCVGTGARRARSARVGISWTSRLGMGARDGKQQSIGESTGEELWADSRIICGAGAGERLG